MNNNKNIQVNNKLYKLTIKKNNMGTNAIEVKIMPESPNTDIEKIKKAIPKTLEGALNIKTEVQEIAFGLKALKLLIAWPEDKDSDIIENKLQEIPGVSSAKIEDIRRAFG